MPRLPSEITRHIPLPLMLQQRALSSLDPLDPTEKASGSTECGTRDGVSILDALVL